MFSTGTPSIPALTYSSTLHEILVSWSPVGSDRVCGPVTYNITVMPSHGMMMMINDTVYKIVGLKNNTNYTITVYASNKIGDADPVTITVRTKSRYLKYVIPIQTYINIARLHSNEINFIIQ